MATRSVEGLANRINHNPDGIETVFTYNFEVDDQDWLKVYADGLPYTEAFTVSGEGLPEGGEVTFDVAPDAGIDILTLIREVPLTQIAVYPVFGPFPPKTHEKALDKLTWITQQLSEMISRCTIAPIDGEGIVFPPAMADMVLVWDSLGENLINGPGIGTFQDLVDQGEGYRDDTKAIYDNTLLVEQTVIDQGDFQVARVASEGDIQTARAEAEADRAEGYADAVGVIPLVATVGLVNEDVLSISGGLLNYTDGIFNYSEGLKADGKGYDTPSQVATGSFDATGVSDGTKWVSRNIDSTTSWFQYMPKYSVDGFSPWMDKGQWYEPYNLIANGDFEDALTGWTATDSTLSIVSETLQLYASVAAANGFASYSITTEIGKKYTLRGDFIYVDTTDALGYVGTAPNIGDIAYDGGLPTGSWSLEFEAVGTTTYISLGVGGGVLKTARFDNIQVQPNDGFGATELTPAPSFIPVPVTVLSEEVTAIGSSELAQNYVKSLAVKQIHWAGAGVPYEDPDAIGANPEATLYPDGNIVGSTENGSYTKYPNGGITQRGSFISSTVAEVTVTLPIECVDGGYDIKALCSNNGSAYTTTIYTRTSRTPTSFGLTRSSSALTDTLWKIEGRYKQ